MDTKTYLGQIKRMRITIENKLDEIRQLREIVCSISVANDGERVQTSTDKDSLGRAVTNIVSMEEETNDLVLEWTEKRGKIIQQIDSMENIDYYNILSLRYVRGETFEKIAEKTNWSIRKVFSIHGEALKAFESKYGHEYLENVQ